jgi:formate-dependent phosphoribosylglycinamide formyltransferase (GAR transformylase)
MKQKVVIIGQGYTGRLSIVRSVAEVECDVTLIALLPKYLFEKSKREKPLDAYSKYVSRCFFSENYNEEMLIDILVNQCIDPNQKTFIFPDNDFSAAAIDNHRDVLKEQFYCPHIHERQGAVEEWMDKVRQKALAQKVGLNVVDSVLIKVKDKQFHIPDGIKYPCFAKPLLSIVGGKTGLKKCENPQELRNHIEFINTKKSNIRILVEDYINIEREYATLGFSDGKEVIIPGVLELVHIGHGSHFGVAVQGRVFSTDGYEDVIDKFKTFVKHIGFVGVFDIDFYESAGKMYFCELNLRFGGSGYAFTKMGVNLPVMMMKSFLGETIDNMNKTVYGDAKYFNERMAIDDWYDGYISTDEYNRLKEESDIKFVENVEDNTPQIILEKEFRIKRIKKTLKEWIGKK